MRRTGFLRGLRLRDCADGPPADGDGSGNHTQWLWAGNAQHMTFAVRSLAGS
ncbi:hypothetical protein [Streptomyces europaeiscabiei]|uniref:hypothetical protein n=1 Tax=Streptomyces europaeiscabiei TaxID=146819 RepID=UPI0038F7BF26